ncbi:hypothetical protein ACSBR2_037873 [Camellia fascicularis]
MPDKYILRRWNKNVKRCHTKVHISYDNSSIKPEARRYDKMFNVFNEVADLATSCDNKCDKVVEQLRELKGESKEEVDVVSGSNKFGSMSTQNASSSYRDGVLNSKESTTILDPIVVRQKGRPPCKRKQSMLEKTIKKKQRVKTKTKTKTKTTSTSSQGNIEQSEFSAPSHMGFVDLGTQESIKINGHHHPSQSWMLGNSSFAKMLNDMAQSQSENPERDKDERS